MHVLFLTTNKEFLKDSGGERQLLEGLQHAAEVLHVVVLTKRRDGYVAKKLDEHTWVYPTNSVFGFGVWSMVRLARFQLYWQGEFRAHVVYSDDVRTSGWAGAWLAFWYDKVWVVNVRTYEWGVRALHRRLFGFFGTMPLRLVLSLAHKVCIFSDLTRLYLSITAAHHENKIVVFPRLYDTEELEKESVSVDVKTKYPHITFSLLIASKLGYTKRISLVFSILALLQKNQYYAKAGLIVVALGGSTFLWRLRAGLRGLWGWVYFVHPQELGSYFKTTNVFLYVAGGDENEDALIRATAAHSPIIAVDSKITRVLIKDGVNGVIVQDSTPEAFVAAIVKLNQSSDREVFRVNSSLYMAAVVPATQQEIVASLQALWAYTEAPPTMQEMPNLDPRPLEAQKASRMDRFKIIWKEMFPPKNSGV